MAGIQPAQGLLYSDIDFKEFLEPVRRPQPDIPAYWGRADHNDRHKSQHPPATSAAAQGVPSTQASLHVSRGAAPTKDEVRFNIKLNILPNGDVRDQEVLRNCAGASDLEDLKLQGIVTSEVNKLASANKKSFLRQMVNGKRDVNDSFVKVFRTLRKAKELEHPIEGESQAEIIARETMRDRIMARYLADIQDLHAHFTNIRSQLARGEIPFAFKEGETDLAVTVNIKKQRLAVARADAWIAACRRADWADAIFHTAEELPPQEYYYHMKSYEEKEEFWTWFFDECAYQWLSPFNGVVDLFDLLNNDPVVREFFTTTFYKLCEGANHNQIAREADRDDISKNTDDSIAGGLAGIDIRRNIMIAPLDGSHIAEFRSSGNTWRANGGREITLHDIPIYGGVRRKGAKYEPRGTLLQHIVLDPLVVRLPGMPGGN
ncbi:hypothetical protein LTS10_004333 [Elasticomyces elasticus]|nr:hypothetical protein LTS10_004333 [Elasticomyces elasticus]